MINLFLFISICSYSLKTLLKIFGIVRVVGRRAARGVPGVESQYFARSLLVNVDGKVYEGEVDCADYAIPSLHSMISAYPAPHNNAYISFAYRLSHNVLTNMLYFLAYFSSLEILSA